MNRRTRTLYATTACVVAALLAVLFLTPSPAAAADTTRCRPAPGGMLRCPGGVTVPAPKPTPGTPTTTTRRCKPGPGGTVVCPGGVRY